MMELEFTEIVVIRRDDESPVFSFPTGASVPRIGEIVRFDFTATDDDRAQYAADALHGYDKINGQRYKVMSVEHVVRKWAWNRSVTTAWVTVEELKR